MYEEIHNLIHQVLDKGKKPNFYFDLEAFEGYELQGLWEDLKVDIAHINDYGNMALVGDTNGKNGQPKLPTSLLVQTFVFLN